MNCGSPRLSRMVRINLRNNRIGDVGAKALAASPYLESLSEVDLSHNEITAGGGTALLESPLGKRPGVRLNLEENELPPGLRRGVLV